MSGENDIFWSSPTVRNLVISIVTGLLIIISTLIGMFYNQYKEDMSAFKEELNELKQDVKDVKKGLSRLAVKVNVDITSTEGMKQAIVPVSPAKKQPVEPVEVHYAIPAKKMDNLESIISP